MIDLTPSEEQIAVHVLMRKLVELHSKLSSLLPSCMLAVNMDYVTLDSDPLSASTILRLSDGDEIAIIPPVSGG